MSKQDREDFQAYNRENGKPCYCASLVNGFCDFCTGLADRHGSRAEDQLAFQNSENPPEED